jgi:hypothetical protein
VAAAERVQGDVFPALPDWPDNDRFAKRGGCHYLAVTLGG